MRLYWKGAALGLLVLVGLSSAKEESKQADKPEQKELLMVELERVGDSRDKRQTEGVAEADFANKEVPPEYLSLLQQLQLQNGEQPQLAAQPGPGLQQYYIAKSPSGVISGGPLDRSPQRFLPAPGEPRPFRPRDPVLHALSRQNSELQAEYQRKALRDQETVFLMPRGPQGADPPRAGPLALSGLYRPGTQAPLPPQGIPVAPGTAVALAQPLSAQPAASGPLPAYSAHEARLRAALQGAEVIQAPGPQQLASPAYVQQLQARGLAQLSGGHGGELSLVREAQAAQLQQQQLQQHQLQQQLQARQPQYIQVQRQQPVAARPQPQQQQPQQQQQQQQFHALNLQELSPAELRFLQRQQQPEQAPQPQYVLQPSQVPQPISQGPSQAQVEEQYLRETTPGGPPPLPAHPAPAPEQAPQHVLQPSPLYLQQVQQLAEQQALAQQQLAAQHQLAAQQQQEAVQYVRQPATLRYAPQVPQKAAPAPAPQPTALPITTPRSSIYVSTVASQPAKPKALLRRPAPAVTIEQLLGPGPEAEAAAEQSKQSLPVVRIPVSADQKPLTQADLQQLIDAGFDVSPVGDVNPTANAYYRSSAAGDFPSSQQQSFAPIVVPDEPAAAPTPRLSARQRQALAQAQEEAYLQARGVRLGSSGN